MSHNTPQTPITTPPVNVSNKSSSQLSTNILNSNTPVSKAKNVSVPVVPIPDVKEHLVKTARAKATSAKK